MTLHDEIARLAEFNDDPAAGGITREVFTPTYADGLEYVAALMRDAGLATRLDAFGNLWGRWDGTTDEPRVITGSHVDTTLNAGAYDGVVGVLGAIDAVRRLRADGFVGRRAIEIVAFAGEEPRFGQGCIGSRALVGALAPPETLVDRDGVSLADALRGAGLDPDRIGEAEVDPATVHAFVELHIEQAAVLEAGGEAIGVVTAIAAPHDFRLTIRGAATHSGATPMDLRRDALTGAAEVLLEIERLAQPGTTVATVGVIRALPGAINVVPGEVALDVDVRDADVAAREAVVEAIVAFAREVAARRGLTVEVTPIVEDLPVQCADVVVDAVRDAVAELGLRSREMTSGAYHDAMLMAARAPVGMLFVPSRDGISHHPAEYTPPEQIDAGVAVLAGTLRRLAEQA